MREQIFASLPPPRFSVRFFTTTWQPSKTQRVRVFTTPWPRSKTERRRVFTTTWPRSKTERRRVFTTTWPRSKTERRRVFTTTWWYSKAQGAAPRPPRAVEPYPGASTIGRRYPNGVEQNTVSARGTARFVLGLKWGDVRVVTCTDGATSVLSHPFRVHFRRRTLPRVRPHALGRGSEPWALLCHHVVVKTLGVACGDDNRPGCAEFR